MCVIISVLFFVYLFRCQKWQSQIQTHCGEWLCWRDLMYYLRVLALLKPNCRNTMHFTSCFTIYQSLFQVTYTGYGHCGKGAAQQATSFFFCQQLPPVPQRVLALYQGLFPVAKMETVHKDSAGLVSSKTKLRGGSSSQCSDVPKYLTSLQSMCHCTLSCFWLWLLYYHCNNWGL